MKNALGKIMTVAAVLAAVLLPGQLQAQKRIYTRSFSMQDFRSKTTKVVLGGPGGIDTALREEVTSLWTVSPYEFCTPAEYEKQKNSPDTYFLHPETVKGIIYLTLSRGGEESSKDAYKRPITVVSLPIGGENDPSGRASLYMSAFVSIIQDYVEKACSSEFAAYSGLASLGRSVPRGVSVITDPQEADSAFRDRAMDCAVCLTITPSGDPSDKPRYRLTFGTEYYEFYSIRK